MVIGIAGRCRIRDLQNLTCNDVVPIGTSLFINLVNTKSAKKYSVQLEGMLKTIFAKYMALRPVDTASLNFFLNYDNGHCFQSPVGINELSRIPREIADYLGLNNADHFTSSSFRISTGLFASEFSDEHAENRPVEE